MSENNLVVRIDQKVGTLNWNFDELNALIDEGLKKYTGLVITEDQIKDAKAMRANLNGLKDQIDRRRIDAGKEFCAPYEQFKAQVKVVTDKIAKCSKAIDVQIKDFEQREKDEKKARIEAWWNDFCKTDPQVPFADVFETKYLNKSCGEAEWQNSLELKFNSINTSLSVIAGIEETNKREYVLTEYMKDYDLPKAFLKYEEYTEKLRKAEEFRKAAEQKAAEKAQDEQKGASEREDSQRRRELPSEVNIPQNGLKQPSAELSSGGSEILERVMRVWGTREQIIALSEFMNQNGIKFRKEEA